MSGILITGGTGSFGQAFVSHCLAYSLSDRVCIYSRDEHKQAQMRHDFRDDPRLRFFIGCVRDRDRLKRAMGGCHTVVHAAALKRIEVGRYNPTEMVKTNVIGATNVVEAATDAGVGRVVALSTDKAWQPVSAYGQSKALAETIFLAANDSVGANGPRFTVTRYGNVAGSNGSVIPRWRSQAGPVTVTDLECTRFWMTMDEAVDLVLKALDDGDGAVGQLLPEALPAYRLGDLAKAMGVEVGSITGLPPWEKLHEGLQDGYTSDQARRMTVDELKEALTHV